MNDEKELESLFDIENKVERSLSYSRMSDFDRNGPSVLIKRTNPDSFGIKIGSIVDDLTLPIEGFKFEDNYVVSDFEKPTATLGKLTTIILDNYTELPNKKEILDICKRNSFWKRSKDDTIIANYDTVEFWGYLKDNIQGNNKNIISTSDKDIAENLSNILKTHEYSKHLFDNDLESKNQFKLDFEYNGLRFKGIIDLLQINHKDKYIRMIDLKTGKDSALNFQNSFIKYRYYLQESIYQKAFKHICEQLNLKGYKLLPFQFLYIGRSEKVPLIYNVSNKWHEAALNGFNIGKYKYKGLNELIEDVKWHFLNNEFEIPREIAENNGIVTINDNFLEL